MNKYRFRYYLMVLLAYGISLPFAIKYDHWIGLFVITALLLSAWD